MIAFLGFSRCAMSRRRANQALVGCMSLADARHVVTHPELYAHRLILRRLAWAALMQARGRRVDHARLAAMKSSLPVGWEERGQVARLPNWRVGVAASSTNQAPTRPFFERKAMPEQSANLAAMIIRVQKMVDGLPKLAAPSEDWTAFNASQRAHHLALNTVFQELRRMHGARVHVTGSHSRMSLYGVKVTSTAGGALLLRNWLSAARRRLENKGGRA